MNKLIRDLQIISKHLPFKARGLNPQECYNQKCPFHCEHDVLMIPSIDKDIWDDMPEEDKKVLEDDWFFSEEYDCLCSFQYGSC